MADKTTYGPGQVSEMLGLPPTTLRRYADAWQSYLSPYAQKTGKKRRYTDTDVLILKKIRLLTNQRKTRDEIAAALQIVDAEDTTQESALALLPQVLQRFENQDLRITELTTEIQRLHDRINRLESASRRRGLLDRLRDRLSRK